ncbi:MAG: hypothetical protein SWK76_00205 [Actinomycetota bacterium]|nr:hypothetical protein [Actinomycetota bacterium]
MDKDRKDTSIPEPPEHLSERSKDLWRQVIPSRALSPGRLILIEEALSALDRADECRGAISGEGLTTRTETTGAIHLHPLAKLERESRAQFIRAWTALGLEWDTSIDGKLYA